MNMFLFLKNEIRQSVKILFSLALILALALSIATAIGQTERMIKTSSAKAAEQFDILIGAKGSRTSLLLASVYLREEMISLVPASALTQLQQIKGVKWSAPLVFGDSVGNCPLVGTTSTFLSAGGTRQMREGRLFTQNGEAVVGALSGFKVGEKVKPHHGRIPGMGHAHSESFTVVGIMPETGTPWDRAILVPVEAIWQMHDKKRSHFERPFEAWLTGPYDELAGFSAIAVKPVAVADAYRIRQKMSSVSALGPDGNEVNLMAIFTGEVLVELYSTLDSAMTAFEWFAASSVIISLLAVLITGFVLGELRMPQFLQLRTMGAPRRYVASVVWLLIMSVVCAGALGGLFGGNLLAQVAASVVSADTGIAMHAALGFAEVKIVVATILLGAVFAILPALKVGRSSLR